MVKAWPNQQVVQARGAHFVQEDDPVTVGKAIADFLLSSVFWISAIWLLVIDEKGTTICPEKNNFTWYKYIDLIICEDKLMRYHIPCDNVTGY